MKFKCTYIYNFIVKTSDLKRMLNNEIALQIYLLRHKFSCEITTRLIIIIKILNIVSNAINVPLKTFLLLEKYIYSKKNILKQKQ